MNVLYIRDKNGAFVPVPTISGKTAYQYAQDGGYTGTEAEFAAKLAKEIPEPYTLPAATADRLGGVMIGDGLNVDEDGRVSVEPEGEYELIERVFAGYALLATQPEDWETNYGAYYEVISYYDANYEIDKEEISALKSVKSWEPYVYYEATGEEANAVIRTAEPDGTPYAFRKVYVEVVTQPADEKTNGIAVCNGKYAVYLTNMLDTTTQSKIAKCYFTADGGMLKVEGLCNTNNAYSQGPLASVYQKMFGGQMAHAIESVRVNLLSKTFPIGTIIKIMGVRAK